jgi:hypothetical protein
MAISGTYYDSYRKPVKATKGPSDGDAAPGGDNPTPGQTIVEDVGRALGVEYADEEELKAADKIESRDRHRWELDPASSEDYPERTRGGRKRKT